MIKNIVDNARYTLTALGLITLIFSICVNLGIKIDYPFNEFKLIPYVAIGIFVGESISQLLFI